VATSIRTVAPFTDGASDWTLAATGFTTEVPPDVWPIRMTAPALPLVMAAASAVVMPVLVTAVMNSCPTRCDCDIAPNARSTQLVAGLVVVGFAEVAAGGAWVVVRDADGEVGAGGELLLALAELGEALPDAAAAEEVADVALCPLPHAATVASRPSSTADTAGRRTGESVEKAFGWRTAEPHTSSIGRTDTAAGRPSAGYLMTAPVASVISCDSREFP
jgi:hypothetical protein